MSKYWAVLPMFKRKNKEEKGEAKEDTLFLSQRRPYFLLKHDYVMKDSFKVDYTEKEIQEISIFYCKNYRIGKSNSTIKLTESDVYRYVDVSSEILTIKKEHIIGSIISIIIPLIINTDLDKDVHVQCSEKFNFFKTENSLIFGATSFLVLDEKYRGKGYGMSLIQESLKVLYDNGGIGAYFINKVSRCDNSITLYNWYYPLNFDKLEKCNFFNAKDYKVYFLENLKAVEYVEKIDLNNIKQAYNFYFDYMKAKKFYFAPSYNYWEKWVKNFPTYILKHEDKIIGLFSFNYNTIKHPDCNIELKSGILLLYVGQVETIKAALSTAKKDFDILYLYEVGDLNKKILINLMAQKTGVSYINFYNTRLKLDSAEFYCPIF